MNGYVEYNSVIGGTPFSSTSVFRASTTAPVTMLTTASTWHQAIEATCDTSLSITDRRSVASFFSPTGQSYTSAGTADVTVVFRRTVSGKPAFRVVSVSGVTAANATATIIAKYTEIYGATSQDTATRVISAIIKHKVTKEGT